MHNILWGSKTGDANSWYHIMPFRKCKLVNEMYVVRYRKPKRVVENINYYTFSNKNKILEIIYYTFNLLKVLSTKKIDLIVSFNPFPWGLISFFCAKIMRKPILLGLIGGELDSKRTSYCKINVLLKILDYVDIITVTGESTKKQLLGLGFKEEKIFIYPHLVDTEYLNITKTKRLESNIVTITSFLPVKRTIDSIKAIALLKNEGFDINLVILGKGPNISICKSLVKELNIEKNIDFVGFVDDIRPYINNSEYYIQYSKYS